MSTKSPSTVPSRRRAETPDLRRRAAALKETAARAVKGRPAGEVTDQPEGESLPRGSAVEHGPGTFPAPATASHDPAHEPATVADRNPAEGAGGSQQESDMGRHETFDTATPIAEDLLSGTMLARAATGRPDPVLVVIAENRRLYAAWTATNALPEVPGTLDRPPEAVAAADAFFAHCRDDLVTTVPRTIDGCRALAQYVAGFSREHGFQLDEDESGTAHLRILDLIARSPADGHLQAPETGGPDTLRAAIEAHRTARAALTATCNPADEEFVRQAGGDASDEAMVPAQGAHDAASDAETEAWDDLLAARPADAAGLARMLRYIAESPASEIVEDPQYLLAHLAEAAEAVAAADRTPIMVSDLGTVTGSPDEVSPALREAAEAHRDARQAMLVAADWSDAARRRHVETIGARLRDLFGVRARSLADLRWKVLYLLPGNLTDHVRDAGLAASIGNICDDLMGLAHAREPELKPEADTDAALLALGREFDVLHAAWLETAPAANAADEAVQAFLDARKQRSRDVMKDHEEAWAQPGLQEAHDREAEAFEKLDPFFKAILAMPARTVQGLAVKARMLSVAGWLGGTYGLLAAERDEEDLVREHVRDLIEATCALAGLDVMGRSCAAVALPGTRPKDRDPSHRTAESVQHDVDRSPDPILAGVDALVHPTEKEPTSSVSSVDREAIALIEAMGPAWVDLEHTDADEPGSLYDRAYARRRELLDAAEHLPATSLWAVCAKALALSWIEYADLWQRDLKREDYARDGRLALDIHAGMMRFGEMNLARGVAAAPSAPFSSDGPTSPASLAGPGLDREDALYAALGEHRLAELAFKEAARAVEQGPPKRRSGGVSEAAVTALDLARQAASARCIAAWDDLLETRPITLAGVLVATRHFAEHVSTFDNTDLEQILEYLQGALEGLRFTGLHRPADHDLSRLTIAELEMLADVCRRQAQAYLAIYNQPACQKVAGIINESVLGGIIDDEYNRIGILGGDAVAELERRTPADDEERNLILEARVRSHLSGNGYIEPDLVAEIVAAWGA